MKKQILILNDNLNELKQLRLEFIHLGYGVITAHEPEIAKELIEKLNIDFVLAKPELIEFSTKQSKSQDKGDK